MPVRSLVRLASIAVCGMVAAAAVGCANITEQIVGPGSDCPAASFNAHVSRNVAASGSSASTVGCDHRAPIEIPIATVIDLNDIAQVLGTRNTITPGELVVWSKDGIRTLPAPPGATSVTGVDLNNKGEAVGCGTYAGGPGPRPNPTSVNVSGQLATADVCHVVVWNAQGVPTDLGLLDPTATEAKAYAINDAGVIVGTLFYASGSQRSFLRSAAGAVTLLPVNALHSAAVDLNEQGMVTGWSTDSPVSEGPWKTWIWTAAGGVVDAGTVPVAAADAVPSVLPVAINESGEVVGDVYQYHSATPGYHEHVSIFLYQPGSGMRDIRAATGFENAVALNDQGEILGFTSLDGMVQPASWATTRPTLLAVRDGWTPGEGKGSLYQINNWNEVLDSYVQGGVRHNVVWTWNPERYR